MAGDPDREGTFIVTDIYPEDLGPNPPFEVLPGLVVDGKEVVGCVVKASQGTAWGQGNEQWFARSWAKLRDVAGDQYGADFFRGCYHFLVFSQDGAAQADYFCDQVEAAGGFDSGDLMPWVDVEEGGQGSWAPQRLETITDASVRSQLADNVTTCTQAFVDRFKQRTSLRIAVYGRGIFRDLQMTDCTFGADSSVNPAYTAAMPPMDKYGVPVDQIIFWQCCGDGTVALPGYPSNLPGWGAEDYSVYIDGPRKTTLTSLRQRCLARAPSGV
ncbi:MAG TPA: GH25 family lysozyme [Roseiarcus sp.]|jgi:GH25 family lysozyme M1 (1,4-beta-N-acetylmuramidase)